MNIIRRIFTPNITIIKRQYRFNLLIIEGKLPSRVLSLVVEWKQEHQEELINDWKSIKETGKYEKIKPLVS
jgi:Domain of unknown function (DUF4160)